MTSLHADTPTSRRFFGGVFLAIAGTALFSLKSIFIKLAYAAGADAESLLTLRMLLALPFYIGMLLYLRGHPVSAPAKLPVMRILLLGFLGYYLASWLDLSGLEYISAQLERLTLFTYPAMVSVLAALFLGEKLTLRMTLAIFVCYLGILTMYWQEARLAAGSSHFTGVLLVLGSALSFSLYILLSKPIMQRVGSRFFTSVAMIGSSGFVFLHFFLSHPLQDLVQNASVWFYAALLAFVSTVIPSFMVSEAIVRIGASRTSIIGSVGPVITLVLAVLVLGEPTSPMHFLGIALVLAGVAAVSLKPR